MRRLVLALLLVTSAATAQRRVDPARRDPVTFLTKTCWLEAGFRTADCVAIVNVLIRRSFLDRSGLISMTRRYSSIGVPSPRQRRASALPWGLSLRDRLRFAELRTVAAGALQGTLRDPCPGALHWGSPNLAADRSRINRMLRSGYWRIAKCHARTSNVFLSRR